MFYVTISASQTLPVMKKLVGLLLKMDSTCTVDLFLIACKVSKGRIQTFFHLGFLFSNIYNKRNFRYTFTPIAVISVSCSDDLHNPLCYILLCGDDKVLIGPRRTRKAPNYLILGNS